MTHQTKGLILAILSAVMYGVMPILGVRITQLNVSLENMLFWRFAIAFLILVMFYPKKIFVFDKISKTHFLYAVFGYMISSFFYFESAFIIGTGIAMAIYFVYPIFLGILNFFVLKERMKRKDVIGLSLALTSLCFLTDFKIDGTTNVISGALIGCVGALGYAVYVFYTRETSKNPLSLIAWVSFGVALFFAVHSLSNNTLAILPNDAYIYAVGIALLGTVLPMIFFIGAVKHIGTMKASLLSIVEPATTLMLGYLFLSEKISLLQSIGLFLMLLFLLLAESDLFKKKKPTTQRT